MYENLIWRKKRGKWSLDLVKYAKQKELEIDTVRKKVALEIFTQVVQKTPVDTGRARGNWLISVGQDTTGEVSRDDKKPKGSKPSFLSQEASKLNGCKGDDTIYICNNLPYIKSLEYGSSKQAPSGMVGLTMANIRSKIDKFISEEVGK